MFGRWGVAQRQKTPRPPEAHPSGAQPPKLPANRIPNHVAIVMDGNGRWANQRGLSRIEGHNRGLDRVQEAVKGAIQIGVKWVSIYAFSTENWRRSPEEIRYLLGYSRTFIRREIGDLDDMGVRILWAGRRPKLWRSVYNELKDAEARTANNDVVNLAVCVNYGGRYEITDAVRQIAQLAAEGKIDPKRINEKTISRHLYLPDMPDVDLFLRPSGEQRASNFLMWQSAYAEFVFQDVLWPDFDRRDLWRACEAYAERDRRLGGAIDAPQAKEISS